ncbi:hypothetical protein Hanom_Chr06g00507951 [Helianthus anomalus]
MTGVRSEMYLKFSTCNLLCSHDSLTPFPSGGRGIYGGHFKPSLLHIHICSELAKNRMSPCSISSIFLLQFYFRFV